MHSYFRVTPPLGASNGHRARTPRPDSPSTPSGPEHRAVHTRPRNPDVATAIDQIPCVEVLDCSARAERRLVEDAARQRRAEFEGGRSAAHRALAAPLGWQAEGRGGRSKPTGPAIALFQLGVGLLQ
jgi:hypothetical protein